MPSMEWTGRVPAKESAMLTAIACKKAKPGDKGSDAVGRPKAYKLTDGGSLHLLVQPGGSKLWQMNYTRGGKQKTLSFGPFPEVTLFEAREKRSAAKKALRDGEDPGVQRKQARAAAQAADDLTFQLVAERWFETKYGGAKGSRQHQSEVVKSLTQCVYPQIGRMPIASITTPMVLAEVLRPIEARDTIEKAHRINQRLREIFAVAKIEGSITENPCADTVRALKPIPRQTPQPAILDLAGLREMLKIVESKPAHPATKLAHRLTCLTAVRTHAIYTAEWSEFDIESEAPVWTIPDSKMKGGRSFQVPLCRQAVEALRVARVITGSGPIVFPSTRSAHAPMSANAMLYMLNRAGYDGRHCPHGWRASMSTIMNERHPTERHIIDYALGHTSKDSVERVYNHAKYIVQRRALAQKWADLMLDGMMQAADLIGLPQR